MAIEPCHDRIGAGSIGEKRIYVALVLAALLTALAGWGIVCVVDQPRVLALLLSIEGPQLGSTPPAIQFLQRELRANSAERVALAAVSLIGCCGCCLFAIAVTIARSRSGETGSQVFPAIVTGTVSGLAAGWLAVVVGAVLEHLPPMHESAYSWHLQWEHRGIMLHVATWLVLSVGIGLATGLAFAGRVSVWRPIYGAAAGGVAAAAIYPFFAALLFPFDRAESLIPGGRWNQLAWLLLTMLMIAGGVCRVLARSPARW